MFNLLRYFSLTSAAVILVLALAMQAAYRQNAVDDLVAMAERHNVALAQSFANTIWSRFSSYVTSVSRAAMSLSLLKFVGQASLVDDAMLPS